MRAHWSASLSLYLTALLAVAFCAPAAAQDLAPWASALNLQLLTNTFGPSDCAVTQNLTVAGTRKLLRFGTEIRNSSLGDVALGSVSGNTNFVFSACHDHYHARNFLRARLKTEGGAVVASADVGLCLADHEPLDLFSPPMPRFQCEDQGLQRGWRAVHGADLEGQWLDVTDLPSGDYLFELEVNANRMAAETDYANNIIASPVSLPRCFALTMVTSFATEVRGNGNAFADPGETIIEKVVVTVQGCEVADASVQLSSTSPGVTWLNHTSTFPAAGISRPVTNLTPLTYRLAKSLPCGANLPMQAVVSLGGVVTTSQWTRRVGTVTILGAATNTYQSADVPRRILDLSTAYSTNIVNVAGTNVIDDVDLLLRINHSFVGDLSLGLQHPDGTEALVFFQSGDSDENFGSGNRCNNAQYTVLDDEAPEWILNAISPYFGSYRPYLPLSVMDGKPLNGAWRLRMTDTTAGDSGTNLCWSLRIAYHREQSLCAIFNTSPTATSFSATVPDEVPAPLLLRGTDDDGDAVTFALVTAPAHGTLSGFSATLGQVTYQAAAGFTGGDSFAFRVTDGTTTSAAASVSISVTSADSDADGLPNAWEAMHFGSPTGAVAAADQDGDGQPNRDEWVTDTNPTNPLSRLEVLAISNAAGQLIYFPSSTARIYRLWSAPNLGAAWSNHAVEAPGNGGIMTLGDTNLPPSGFYRVGVRIP